VNLATNSTQGWYHPHGTVQTADLRLQGTAAPGLAGTAAATGTGATTAAAVVTTAVAAVTAGAAMATAPLPAGPAGRSCHI